MDRQGERMQVVIGELQINSHPLRSKGTYERWFDTNVGLGNKRGIRERELVAGIYFMQTRGYTIEQFARAADISVPRLEYIMAQAEFDLPYRTFRDSILHDNEVRDKFRAEYKSFDKFGDRIGNQDKYLKVDNADVPDKEIGRNRLMAAYYLCTFEYKTLQNVADALVMNEDTLSELWDEFIGEEWFEEARKDMESWAAGEGSRETNYLRKRCFQVLERANINTVDETERIRVLRYHPDNLRGIKRELYTPEKYHEYCRIAVAANGLALQHTPQDIKIKDREMCLMGVREYGAALKYIPYGMRDREICKAAVSNFGYALWDVPPRIKDRDICWTAVMEDGRAIQFAPKSVISEDLYIRAEADFKELYKPQRFAPDDAKLNRIRRTEIEKETTGISVRNLPKKAPVIQVQDVTLSDLFYFIPGITRSQKLNAEKNWQSYAPKVAEYANRAIEFRMGNISAFEFLKKPPFNYSTLDMTESWAFREAVTESEYWVQKFPEKMRLFLMPKPYFMPKTPLNVPLLTLKQCKEANTYGAPTRMNTSEKAAFQILETYHAELAIAYRKGLLTARDYFNTPPAPFRDGFSNEKEMKAAADLSTAYYADLFREQISNKHIPVQEAALSEEAGEKRNIRR